ncbi:glycoside hydrolase [Choiromyces venosus 120613-1]|uniref:Probable beta-glucosidase btgE n=1 Tax=Choiromyces venosus 120613-1 TaxID=1336337 RepID=A0A3N4IXB6_9PEZI|nr:glycoside hydrolase [Choiromyces venosus 120613-1]
MRYSLLALAATTLLSSSASARGHQHRRHAHPAALAPRGECEVTPPQCTTYTSSILVPVGTVPASDSSTIKETMTVVPVVEPTTTVKSTMISTATSTNVVTVTKPSSTVTVTSPSSTVSTPAPVVPTPIVTVCPTPGTYTIPAKTVVLTSTETVCVPETTSLPPGTHTVGGVTTIVQTATTVVCPVATVETAGDVTTSKVVMTTYICPTAGTYTIGASTTTVTGTVTVPCTYPVPTSYPPGTYTQPEVVTTVTVTSQVVVCPYTSSGLPTSAPVAPTTSASVAPTTSAPAAPTTTAPAATTVDAKSIAVVSATSVTSSAAPSSSVSTSTSKLTAGGGHWAFTYSPYSNSGGCKTASEVSADIADIASKGFQNIRLYSTDCDGLNTVGTACAANGVGIILGVFIKAGGVSTADEQVKNIIAWKKFNLVVLFVVGNEAVFNGYCSAEELAAYILKVKGQLQGAGYTGQITTTEPLNILQEHGSVLCGAMDVVGVNIHPFFNPGVTADKAGEFLKGQLKLATDVCGGGKPGWVLEAGWPSAGLPNGLAVPGVAEQKTAIAAIATECPGQVAFFTYTNDMWKTAGPFGVETNFGCSGLF